MFAQKSNVYEFFATELGGTKTLTVKGEYQGNYADGDIYYEKSDALNHKIKKVKLVDGRLYRMDAYEVNETLLKVSNLRVKEEQYDGKTFFIVKIESNNDKKPIMFKQYFASKGAFDPNMNQTFSLNVPFATKAKAEAFIADLRNDMK
jgi:hypothetical protein